MVEYKQALVVRTDLRMGKGKLAVQVAHASVMAAFKVYDEKREWFNLWCESGQKKVVLKVGSEAELYKIYEDALKLGLPVVMIKNAGLTQLPPGTSTAIGIGPAPSNLIDKVTKQLKLL